MNNDLISRSTLKEDMKSRISACNEWIEKAKDKETKIRASTVKAFIAEVIMTINNAPTVERPHGEWKVYGKQGGIPITDMCSNCRYEMKWYKNKYKFCPNCGADMKGGAE